MYLYYELGSWSAFDTRDGYMPMARPDSLAPTMELTDLRYASASYDGEALLIVPGPDGMLSTLHFDSIRDGLEECAFCCLRSQRFNQLAFFFALTVCLSCSYEYYALLSRLVGTPLLGESTCTRRQRGCRFQARCSRACTTETVPTRCTPTMHRCPKTTTHGTSCGAKTPRCSAASARLWRPRC